MRRPLLSCIAGLAVLAGAAPSATAVPRGPGESALEQAREESGLRTRPVSERATPVGTLRLEDGELLAARFGQPIRVQLTLGRDVARGELTVHVPGSWRAVQGSRRDGNDVSLPIRGAQRGSVHTIEVADLGIPAGTHRIAASFRSAGGPETDLGDLELRLYAPVREAPEQPAWEGRLQNNVTNDLSEESETFITAVPGNAQRILVGVNGGPGGFSAWLSNNGGDAWGRLDMPTTLDRAGTTNDTNNAKLCCDPTSAADAAGNIWYGGLATTPGFIVVNRIAAGTSAFQPKTVAVPRRTNGTQDKPMMTIDNAPSSPTFGRLYMVWDEPASGGVNLVVSKCDTRVLGALDASICDNADNWTTPVSVTKATGSYIYGDVAVGRDGTAYVTWWDYSATNAIRGATCAPGSACDTAAGWSAASTVAGLDATGGAPVPFACPIPAQPGGRAAPAPSVATDISDAATAGRVYVTWGDLRAGSGTTRCADNGVQALPTNLTWDSFVATADRALPVAGATGTSRAPLYTDGTAGAAANSDEWFPWIAVDQTTGRASADFYSTRDDASRATTNTYARSVSAGATLGALTRASTAASNYSTAPCCNFGNDYGDYTGIDATGGVVLPVWSDKQVGFDGEALMTRLSLGAPGLAPVAAIAGPDTATAGETVTFDASGSSDPDGTIAAYAWDLDGDGTFETATGAVPRASTSYATAGTRSVRVQVLDNDGNAAVAARPIAVAAAPAPSTTSPGATTPTPTPTPATTTPAPAVAPVTPARVFIRIARNGATVRIRAGAVPVALRGCAGCTGRVTLRTARLRLGTRARRWSLGTAVFVVGRSGAVRVSVTLSRTGRALFRRHRRLAVTALLRVRSAAGERRTATGRLTIRR